MPSGTPPAEIEEVTKVNGPESESDLLRRAARVLGERLGGELEAPVGERGSLVLRLARDVAHAGERQQAPLTAYLVGRYVELRRQATGMSEADALAEAARDIATMTASDLTGQA